jgi:HlyD family secretion protein
MACEIKNGSFKETPMQATTGQNKKRKIRTTWIIVGIVIAILLALGFLLVQRISSQRAAVPAKTGDVVTAFVGDLAASATASGQVEAEQIAKLSVNSPELVEDILVREGSVVQAGDALVQLDSTDFVLQVARAQQNLALKEANLEALLSGPEESEVASAEAAVASAQAYLDDLLAGPSEEDIAESEATIRQQQAGVASAASSYQSTVDSVSQISIASAEADLVNAQIAYNQAKEQNEKDTDGITHEAMLDAAEDLAIAQSKVDELRAGANQGKLNSASADISAASSNLAQAKANHNSLLSGSSADQIAAAEASLDQAKSSLSTLIDGASSTDIAIAEAELEQARLALIDAEETLRKATISAPFDGVITAVNIAAGERASGEVIELVSDELKVILGVDEIDVGVLAPGQEAIITLETWPDEEISGEIVSISPSAGDGGDGIVTYDVQINLEEPAGLSILVGMTANAKLITANNENVLLVPNAAITADRQAGTYWVNLVTDEAEGSPITEEVEVTIGFKDDDYTQIISGLSEGDEVLVGELAAPTIQFGGFGGGD